MNLVVIKPLYVFFAKVLHKTPCLISLSKDDDDDDDDDDDELEFNDASTLLGH